MTNLIEFITQGSTDFDLIPIIGLMVFTIIFDGLMYLIGSIVKAVNK